MSSNNFSFMLHPLTAPERLWLTELSRSPIPSPRIAKVRLVDQLPSDFSPERIDPRLYYSGRPTLIGLWHVDKDNPLLRAIDLTVREVQRRIRADATLTTITAKELAQQTDLSEIAVAEALYEVSQLGNFFTQAQGIPGNPRAYSSIELTGDTLFDEYLRYTVLEELLERIYVQRGKGLATAIAYSQREIDETVPGDASSETVRNDQQDAGNWRGIASDVQRAIEAGWASGMPPHASALYGRWWQLESWLRSLLYVELRALLGSQWESALPKRSESRQQGESEFHYMTTPDAQDRLAYADASALFQMTLDNWNLFSGSLPARGVWTGRIEELLAIRNRIGHCRRPHSDDLVRLEQTLRDLDKGAFKAAAAFNKQGRASESWTDPLVDGWVRKRHETAIRLIEHAERRYETIFELRYSRRPWAMAPNDKRTISGAPGHLWHAFWYFRGGRSFDLDGFWRDIAQNREQILFVCADSPSSISVSFSAMEVPEAVADVIGTCFDAALSHIGRGRSTADFMRWQAQYAEVDPRVQVATPWSSIDESMRETTIFAA